MSNEDDMGHVDFLLIIVFAIGLVIGLFGIAIYEELDGFENHKGYVEKKYEIGY